MEWGWGLGASPLLLLRSIAVASKENQELVGVGVEFGSVPAEYLKRLARLQTTIIEGEWQIRQLNSDSNRRDYGRSKSHTAVDVGAS